MRPDLTDLLPSTKSDTDKAKAVVSLGFPAVEPALPSLMEWMQDINWPVAQVLQPFLAHIGAPLEPHIRVVLQSDDEIWKFWVLQQIVAKSEDLVQLFQPELRRLANQATPKEQAEELDVLAKTILECAQ